MGLDLNSGFALTPGDFLSLNPNTGVPCLATKDQQQDPDFLLRLSSSRRLLETWRKGQRHPTRFGNWFSDYVLSLHERTQRHLKAPRIQSEMQPARGDVVLLKENSPRGTWKLGIIEELTTSSDGEVRAATVRTMLNRTLNFLYPLECSVSGDKPTKLEETVVDNETQDEPSKQKTEQTVAHNSSVPLYPLFLFLPNIPLCPLFLFAHYSSCQLP